ncbi:chemotaxis protein CheA [Idiomarina xiamenensis]|uniref:Chemotaxis protein CheA n=1 Tax=Idiomarina xiamenensis 10-D-4 TaxID=740709 RepID=K2KDP6_9GAMM|nr:chemotaxis protein CheA [Idiomarina xiamenensis]EKE80819.1 chemotaxis-specific histidine kinase [Idiomarina xiamenensis 10-D-4]
MSFDVDEDILQDFLIEAGEILEQLSGQLVELENDPENKDLLNAIFRGFHTVKGGAGFLSLTELVHTCHGAENVFDTLRNGGRPVTSELMDVILQALDTINAQFAAVQAREEPTAAEPALLEALERLSLPASDDDVSAPSVTSVDDVGSNVSDSDAPVSDSSDSGGIDDISEDEFESLLDELHGSGQAPSPKPNQKPKPSNATPAKTNEAKSNGAADDDITDDEFEALLDQIHGSGQAPSGQSSAASQVEQASDKTSTSDNTPAASSTKATSSAKAGDDEISDDEFEALLDQLHGSGQAPKASASPANDNHTQQASSKAASTTKSPAASKETKPAASASAPANAPAAAAKATADSAKKASPAPAASAAETTVRVDTKRLDDIMNMVGELVLVRNRLLSLSINDENESMNKAIANLDVVTGDLQGAVMKTRMQPIKKVFGRFPRVVRDLARSLKKEINLELEGEETDLDKNLVEALADPLVHLVRNAVDHGIEMPEQREKSGKPRVGTVKLSASQEGDHILLSIRDDGAGMDAEKLKGIAIKRGILDVDAAARMSNEDAYALIFAPGFSTKEQISDISGRGVGMDVVKTKINQLNGSVSIDSELGRGTTLEIKVPLTLAILPTLMVEVKQQTFALPLAGVSEIINLDMARTNVVDGQLTLIVREKAIPLFFLEHWLVRHPDRKSRNEEGHVVVIQVGTQQVGFVVDGLIGQEEVVIKPLDTLLQGTPGMAGATITSDGGIALIIDVSGLLKAYARR